MTPGLNLRVSGLLATVALVLCGCGRQATPPHQGYLEAEFIYMASPLSGHLESLAVKRGSRIAADTLLFTLENSAERAAQKEASDRLRSAQARYEDLKKGSRPSELATLAARTEKARTAVELSKRELARNKTLFENGAISIADLDRAAATHDHDVAALAEIQSEATTAQLGGRSDAVAAAEAEVAAAAAAKDRADWSVAQKTRAATCPALVYDTLYRAGEFVDAGRPVVALLPAENLKVRFFVPEPEFASFKTGDRVRVKATGLPHLEAKVNYLSPKPEYTPPILYNRDNRAKLVFMVEAALSPDAAADLHPGQPVEVTRITQ